MALNFPNSPSDGDIYEGYIWNATVGAWQTATDSSSLGNIGDVEITSPTAGDSLVYDGSDWVNGPRSGNAIINGDFGVWQRGTSFTGSGYNADRFQMRFGADSTVTRQTFTPADIEAVGYGDAEFFLRATMETGSSSSIDQFVEDVRTFAGQTVTLSFWAKANASTSAFCEIDQNFGSGGSSPNTVATESYTIGTSWERFSFVFDVDSVVGKTIGSGSYLHARVLRNNSWSAGATIDVWGVQLEAGPVATPFKLAGGGSKAAELALCERYYQVIAEGSSENFGVASVYANNSDNFLWTVPLRTEMRAVPSLISTTGTDYYAMRSGNYTFDSFSSNNVSVRQMGLIVNILNAAPSLSLGFSSVVKANNVDAFVAADAEI